MKKPPCLILYIFHGISLYAAEQLTVHSPDQNSSSFATMTACPPLNTLVNEEDSLQIESVNTHPDNPADLTIKISCSESSDLDSQPKISQKSSTNTAPIPDEAPVGMGNPSPLKIDNAMDASFVTPPFGFNQRNAFLVPLTPLDMENRYSNTVLGKYDGAEYDRRLSVLMQEQDKIKEQLKKMRKNICCTYITISMLACGLAAAFAELHT